MILSSVDEASIPLKDVTSVGVQLLIIFLPKQARVASLSAVVVLYEEVELALER